MTRISAHLVIRSLTVLSLAALAPVSVHAQNFADTLISSSGLGTNVWYNNPGATLGQPATLINGVFDVPSGTYHACLAYPAYSRDPAGNNLIVTLGTAGAVTVKFTTPIVHSALHWYGDDFIVFGNTFFPTTGGVTPTTNMTTLHIGSTGGIYQNGTPSISVSADGVTFVPLSPTTAGFPTNPFRWVGISGANPTGWNDSSLQDFTKPVNPSLTASNFAGQTVAYAANTLYNGSAGGAAFTLTGSGLSAIQYIRFTGGGASSVIDAVSRVSNAAMTTMTHFAAPDRDAWTVIGNGALIVQGARVFGAAGN